MKRWVGGDPKLEWPIKEHHAILLSNSTVDRERVLDMLERLRKQNEYAQELSAEVRTLRKKCDSLEKENRFLTEQLNKE